MALYLATGRRADQYRKHARELAASAEHERDDTRRKHMLDLAATYERAADQMAPPPAEPPNFPQIMAQHSKIFGD